MSRHAIGSFFSSTDLFYWTTVYLVFVLSQTKRGSGYIVRLFLAFILVACILDIICGFRNVLGIF